MVDVKALFQSRYPAFCQKHKRASAIFIRFIQWLWHEKTLHEFIEKHPTEEGAELVAKGFEFINFSIKVNDNDKANIPKTGPLIVVANHPIGSLDGVGLLKLVTEVRPDTKVVANALLYSVKQMQNCIIPTDNLGKGADRQSIKAINQHLKNGGALTLFPAGSVSRVYDGKIQDKRWNNAYIKLAEKHQCAIVPVYFEAKNSAWFYLLSKLSFPLSTLWLVRELFNYKNKTINAYIGPSIQPETLFQQDQSTDQLSQFVRNKVYSLAK